MTQGAELVDYQAVRSWSCACTSLIGAMSQCLPLLRVVAAEVRKINCGN